MCVCMCVQSLVQDFVGRGEIAADRISRQDIRICILIFSVLF